MEKLKMLRKSVGLTQEQLAERLNVKRTTVTMWETGQNTPPTKYLVELADVFGCSVDELLRTETA